MALNRKMEETSKITKILKIQNGKSLIKWQNQKVKHNKRMDYNRYIPELVQTFSLVENFGLNLVLKLAKTLTCMAAVSHYIDNDVLTKQKDIN